MLLKIGRRLFSSGAWPQNLFLKFPELASKPGRPIDPFIAGYLLPDEKRNTIFNRERLIKLVIHNIRERYAFLKASGIEPKDRISREVAYLMGTFGASGSGKTYSIGHIMQVVKNVHDPLRMEETKKYLINCLEDEKGGLNAFDTLSEYVVIPLTFNNRQTFDQYLEKDYTSIILSRIVSSLSDKKISHKKLYPVVSSLVGTDSLAEQTYGLLDAIYRRQSEPFKYIFVLDELMMIKNETLRTNVLSQLCTLMDERASTFVIATSLDVSVLLKANTPSKRNVRILPLDPVPSLILNLHEYRAMVEKSPSIAAILFDRMSNPRWLIENETKLINLSRRNLPFWELFQSTAPLNSNFRDCMTQRTVENLSNILIRGNPIGLQTKVGEYETSGRVETLTASGCLYDNIFTKFNISAYKEGNNIKEDVDNSADESQLCAKFVPVSNVSTFYEILSQHQNVLNELHCAAYWAMCMTLINPWIDRFGNVNGEGFEIFDAFNELLQRMGAYHRFDYFACADPMNVTNGTFQYNQIYKRLPKKDKFGSIIVNAHSSYCVAYMDEENHISDIIDGMGTISLSEAPTIVSNGIYHLRNSHFAHFKLDKIDYNKSSLEQATKYQLDLFRRGGVLLFNIPKGRGYDYVLADGNILTFYECKFSKAKDASAHSKTTLTNSDITSKYEMCSSIFENVNRILGPNEKFSDFRLIFKAYRASDIENIQNTKNIHILGPEECSATYPPTLRNRLEMALLSGPTEAFESFAQMIKKH